MSAAKVDIEQIVRQVLRQLDGSSIAARPTVADAPVSASGELHVSEPVVTLSHLKGQLDGVKSVAVLPAAVVTPAARDLLKLRGIELTRSQKAAKQPSSAVVLAAAETDYDAAGLTRMLTQQGISTERLAQCGLIAVVDELVDAVARGGKIGVLLTRQTAAALCLANRTRGVQAVLATSAEAIRSARSTFGANLLVLEPKGKAVHELAGIIRTCATLAPHWADGIRPRLS
ncbi:MAG: hypothetical protein EXR98_22735 [Gemmataceae bacterium]|nr:hypothetical protein [Gemmataceae bacterium]